MFSYIPKIFNNKAKCCSRKKLANEYKITVIIIPLVDKVSDGFGEHKYCSCDCSKHKLRGKDSINLSNET